MNLIDKISTVYNDSITNTIFIHSSVITSSHFDELCECFEKTHFSFKMFKTGIIELRNYLLYNIPKINSNIILLESYVNSGKVCISEYSEYDLTAYNREIKFEKETVSVIFGSKKAFSDFSVHCNDNDKINVMLLEKVKDTYLFLDTGSLRSAILRNEYNAKWNASSYSFSDVLQSGTFLYYGDKRVKFKLREKIGGISGEGSVYNTSIKGYLCKIYKKNILQRGFTDKLNYVINRKNLTDKAAWPETMVYNYLGQPIGFLMKAVNGESLENVLYAVNDGDRLPTMYRIGYMICQTIFLFHSQNIIVGDISPRDILVDKKLDVTFVDSDSFQYDDYPCVGFMYEYKYKDLDPKLIKSVLRPFVYEYFSLSVILYQMLMKGHFPNEININVDEIEFGDINSSDMKMFDYRRMQFPLKVGGYDDRATEAVKRLWMELPQSIQCLFTDEFTYRRVVSATEWQLAFEEEINKK